MKKYLFAFACLLAAVGGLWTIGGEIARALDTYISSGIATAGEVMAVVGLLLALAVALIPFKGKKD